ncbi:MAG: solute carrier family 26 protein [Saprospiraceae bacterium]|nr:solute carrier family 26 protein [Saprospiraceae bacterium]
MNKIARFFPFIESLKGYSRSLFRSDVSAGLTVGIMLVPQGMAYAFLAGMPPIYGLYGGLVPLFLYAFFGTSRQLSIGPVAVSSLLVLEGFRQIAVPGSAEYVGLVILGGLMIGVLQALFGLLRLGFLVNFLSHPVLSGFTTAAAIIIGVSQLKDLLGVEIPRFAYVHETIGYAIQHIGETNWISVVVCVSSIVIMLILRSISRSIPGALIVVIIATLVTYGFRLDLNGLEIIKNVPAGLPAFEIPGMDWNTIQTIFPTVLTITVIGVVECISIAKVMEARHKEYSIRPNQEMLAIGISKIGGAFFQALPTSGSFTRSAINDEAGGKTTISSIITAILIALTLVFLTPLFYYLPKAVLAAIILLAVRSLFAWKDAIFLWKTHRKDLVMMIITFLATLVLGIQLGVLIGVVLSIVTVLYKSSRPHYGILGRIPGTTNYRNILRFPEAKIQPDELILRFDDQLYFGNATYYKDVVKNMTEIDPNIKAVFLDARSMHDIDSTGLLALSEIHTRLQDMGIQLYIGCIIGPVRDLLKKAGFWEALGEEHIFRDIHDAVMAYREKNNLSEVTKDS